MLPRRDDGDDSAYSAVSSRRMHRYPSPGWYSARGWM
jgi:hypothetical protein